MEDELPFPFGETFLENLLNVDSSNEGDEEEAGIHIFTLLLRLLFKCIIICTIRHFKWPL